MKLYHATYNGNIIQFDSKHSRKDIDFGPGLYVTDNLEQAINWSTKNNNGNGTPVVTNLTNGIRI